jgi:hypothetical protein
MKRLFIILLFLSNFSSAQFNYSTGVGMGIFIPEGMAADAPFNTAIKDSGLSRISQFWLPLTYDFSVTVYPSVKLGYFRYSSAILSNLSSNNFAFSVVMNGMSVQTFFSFMNKFEATFGMVPLIGSANFIQDELPAITTPFDLATSTEGGMSHSFVAYYSWIGLRYHLKHWLALETALGYLDAEIDGKSWKNNGETVDFQADIKLSGPTLRFGVVFGW